MADEQKAEEIEFWWFCYVSASARDLSQHASVPFYGLFILLFIFQTALKNGVLDEKARIWAGIMFAMNATGFSMRLRF
jgi:hypothetical protein